MLLLPLQAAFGYCCCIFTLLFLQVLLPLHVLLLWQAADLHAVAAAAYS